MRMPHMRHNENATRSSTGLESIFPRATYFDPLGIWRIGELARREWTEFPFYAEDFRAAADRTALEAQSCRHPRPSTYTHMQRAPRTWRQVLRVARIGCRAARSGLANVVTAPPPRSARPPGRGLARVSLATEPSVRSDRSRPSNMPRRAYGTYFAHSPLLKHDE